MIYAQLNKEDYCEGICILQGEVMQDNMILLDVYDETLLNRKYDSVNKMWIDEYLEPPIYTDEDEVVPNEKMSDIQAQISEIQNTVDLLLLKSEGII